MTKTELRKIKKKELLKLAKKEKLDLPEKILKPELVEKLYLHLLKKERKSPAKKKAAAKKSPARKEKKERGRRKKGKEAAVKGDSPATAPPAENGRTIRQKAVSGKYYLEKESGKVVLKEERDNLPAYDVTRIEALVRDPRCIFTYWEISSHDIGEIADSFGAVWNECRTVLRVYTFGDDGDRKAAFDIDIPFGTDNWYIDVYPGTRYQVGVGVISPEGIYTEISISGEVQTPRESACGYQEDSWARPAHLIERIFEASGEVYFRTGASRGTSGMALNRAGSESVSSFGAESSGEKGTALNAELVIRGVAGEDAVVSLYENEIIPSEDGSFTIRMELSDGEVEIPLRVLSGGGTIEKKIVASIDTREKPGD